MTVLQSVNGGASSAPPSTLILHEKLIDVIHNVSTSFSSIVPSRKTVVTLIHYSASYPGIFEFWLDNSPIALTRLAVEKAANIHPNLELDIGQIFQVTMTPIAPDKTDGRGSLSVFGYEA